MDFFTFLIFTCLTVFFGLFFIDLALPWNIMNSERFLSYLESGSLAEPWARTFLFIIGVIFILSFMRYIEHLLRRSRKEKSITLETALGKVSITLFAIEDMLRKMLEEYEELTHIKPKVLPKKKRVSVVIRSDLAAEINIRDFTTEVQEKVQKKLEHLLGQEKEIDVKIDIRKVLYRRSRVTANNDEAEEEPEVPFRNY